MASENTKPTEPQQDLDSYAIVGTKGSGKTVYFVCATDRLQRALQHHAEKWEFTDASLESHQYRDLILNTLKNGRWPDKTPSTKSIQINLVKKWNWWNLFSGSTTKTLTCSDAEGSAFGRAFNFEKLSAPVSQHEAAEIKKLKDELVRASGVFLVMDCVQVHHGLTFQYNSGLFEFLQFLKSKTKVSKIALIFTKYDYFKDGLFNPALRLQQDSPNSWNMLNNFNLKTFNVSSVSNVICDEKGEIMPPHSYQSKDSLNLLESMSWMLDIELPELVTKK